MGLVATRPRDIAKARERADFLQADRVLGGGGVKPGDNNFVGQPVSQRKKTFLPTRKGKGEIQRITDAKAFKRASSTDANSLEDARCRISPN
jgi:hypothetical protein